LAGKRIDGLGSWIATLDAAGQEQARILRWATIIAHGRAMSTEARSDKTRLPLGLCYTFQPETAPNARYIPETVRDFSAGTAGPLATRRVD
jgi:hypothetical protein